MRKSAYIILLAGLVVLLTPAGIAAQSEAPAQSAAPQPSESQAGLTPAHKYFTDVLLLDQDGKQLRFYSDLIKGRVVIINAMFTVCKGVCPHMSRTMQMIQDWLGERLGKEVLILSFSVDRHTDTPPVLKEYASKYHAKPGWHFLTGKKESLDLALRKLGQYVEAREDHSNLMIIGNDRTGLWKKAFGLAKPEDIIKIIESVINDNQINAR